VGWLPHATLQVVSAASNIFYFFYSWLRTFHNAEAVKSSIAIGETDARIEALRAAMQGLTTRPLRSSRPCLTMPSKSSQASR
jgi:hypothetical protein